MTNTPTTDADDEMPFVLGAVYNLGKPIKVADVGSLTGFLIDAVPAGGGQAAQATKGALTSDEPFFHRCVEGIEIVVREAAVRAGTAINLRKADTALLVFKPEGTAEFWIDTAAESLQCIAKRTVGVATAVFERDIADIVGMNFPAVSFAPEDRVVCLFREGWGFGLAFDFNPDGSFDRQAFSQSLGTLVRTLRYRHLYGAMKNPAVFQRLLDKGWFPFAEIINAEVKELSAHAEAGFDLSLWEQQLVASFDGSRLDRILQRWKQKPHFEAKMVLLEEAIGSFKAERPASVIKIVLTEFEGVLNDAHRAANGGAGARLKDLLKFVSASAEAHTGGTDTLLFPAAFGKYLEQHTFANFDPVAQTGTAGSRHAVGHGAAAQETYTMTRALQAILTLDQLAFYT
jgi:hypothetical protein